MRQAKYIVMSKCREGGRPSGIFSTNNKKEAAKFLKRQEKYYKEQYTPGFEPYIHWILNTTIDYTASY